MKAAPKGRRKPAGSLALHAARFHAGLQTEAEETRGTYRRALGEFLRWASSRAVRRVRPGDVLRYRDHLVRSRRLRPASVATYLTALRRFLAFLVEEGRYAANPAVGVRSAARPRRHLHRPLSADEMRALLASLPGEGILAARDRAMLLLMARCAVSETELVRLRRADVRLEQGGGALMLPAPRPTASPVAIPLRGDAARALEAYLAMRGPVEGGAPLLAGAGNRSSASGLTTRAVRARVHEAFTRAGIRGRGVGASSLRLTAAAEMLEAGGTPEELRRALRLGTATTAALYLSARRPGRDEGLEQH